MHGNPGLLESILWVFAAAFRAFTLMDDPGSPPVGLSADDFYWCVPPSTI